MLKIVPFERGNPEIGGNLETHLYDHAAGLEVLKALMP